MGWFVCGTDAILAAGLEGFKSSVQKVSVPNELDPVPVLPSELRPLLLDNSCLLLKFHRPPFEFGCTCMTLIHEDASLQLRDALGQTGSSLWVILLDCWYMLDCLNVIGLLGPSRAHPAFTRPRVTNFTKSFLGMCLCEKLQDDR